MKLRALSLLLVLSACNAAPDRPLDSPDSPERLSPSPIYVAPEAYPLCFSAGSPCGPDVATPCCDGLFCSNEILAYGPGSCSAPLPDGSFCIDDSHCESGRCMEYTCADPSCREHGSECYDDPESCCPGLICFQDPGAYGLALCGPPQPSGMFCLDDAACASGSCVDNVCQ